MGLNNFTYSDYTNTIAKKYLVPQRLIAEHDTDNPQFLLKDIHRQAALNTLECCVIRKGGYVVLDFGSELQGGIDLTVAAIIHEGQTSEAKPADKYGHIRIVFGESVTEAMSSIGGESNALNDHSTRDMTVETCGMSTMRYGNTGFRFVKIEAIDKPIYIGGVKGVLEYKDIEYKGSFRCNDERLNTIFDTAAYTVHLNMQDYIWDGIKRDRLVWIGDMHPEMSTICSVFGYDECVERSLDFTRDCYPITDEIEKNNPNKIWMVFPSYTCWWIKIHRDWYYQNGNLDYLMEQKDYMYKACNKLAEKVHDDGTLHFCNDTDQYFTDWSSNETPYMEAGFRGCFILAMEAAAEIFDIYGDGDMSKKCSTTAQNLKKIVPQYEGNKQTCAMTALSGLCDAQEINEIISKDLLKGLSTFYGYYVLHALAKAGNTQGAIDAMRNYWGAMLDLGATTFWEDFDIDWIENAARIDEIVPEGKTDVHAAYGKFCYQKLRHSLCHGWASGPAPFMTQHILGVKVAEPGCAKLIIEPHLGDLEWAKGTYPTPHGVVEIEHNLVDGKIETKVNAPERVKIEVR